MHWEDQASYIERLIIITVNQTLSGGGTKNSNSVCEGWWLPVFMTVALHFTIICSRQRGGKKLFEVAAPEHQLFLRTIPDIWQVCHAAAQTGIYWYIPVYCRLLPLYGTYSCSVISFQNFWLHVHVEK